MAYKQSKFNFPIQAIVVVDWESGANTEFKAYFVKIIDVNFKTRQ